MRYSQVLGTLVGLLTLVYLVVVPEATAVGRMRVLDDTPVPARFAHSTRCYRLAFWPAGFARDIHGRQLNFLQLRDSVLRPPWHLSRRDWDNDGHLSSFAKAHAYWSMAGADSIDITVALEWYMGYALRLSVRSDTLTGRAWAWSDVPFVAPGATVRAAPIACWIGELFDRRTVV